MLLWLAVIGCGEPPPPEITPPVVSVAPPPASEAPKPQNDPPPAPPTEERYAASHILIQHAGAVDSTQSRTIEEARTLAETLRSRALGGEDFATLAREHSEGPSAPRGGELGVYRTGTMVPPFETAVAELDVGEIGEVVSSPFGLHVVRRDAVVQARASHIVFRYEGAWRSSSTRTIEDATVLARQTRAELVAGTSFSTLARERSEDDSASLGGDLGLIAPGQMVPSFEDAVFALAVGELSEPVRTPYGIHLIKRTE